MTITRRFRRLWRARAGGIAVAYACSVSTPALADIVIAVVGPSSGRNAPRTATITAAARVAAASVNAAGGVNGDTLAVIATDDGCAPKPAIIAATGLVARKVSLVLGHPCATAAIAAAGVYGKASVLFIATATRHPALTSARAGPTIFRIGGRDDRQGEMAGRLLARAAPGARVAIVHDRTQYGRAIADAAAAAYKRERGGDAISATIVGGDKDYKLTVAKVKDAAIVFFAGFPLEGGLIYSALRSAGSAAEFIASDSLATAEFSTTFRDSAKGVHVLVSSAAAPGLAPPPGAPDPALIDADASEDALRVRTAIDVFAAAARKAGRNDGAAIAAELQRGAFATLFGPISFTAAGDARVPSFQLIEWLGDGWAPASQTR